MTDADLLRQQRRIAAARTGLRHIEERLREIEVAVPERSRFCLVNGVYFASCAERNLTEVWRIIRDERRRKRKEAGER